MYKLCDDCLDKLEIHYLTLQDEYKSKCNCCYKYKFLNVFVDIYFNEEIEKMSKLIEYKIKKQILENLTNKKNHVNM